jgi:cephalosporin-C deacetylase
MKSLIDLIKTQPFEIKHEQLNNPRITRFSYPSHHGDLVYGHLFETDKKQHPACILLYHGLGAHTMSGGYLTFVKWWNDQGYDVIGMDVRNQGGLTKGKPSVDPRGLYLSGIDSFEDYYYTSIYVDAYLLVDVATQLKNYEHIYATGGSQGGALALFVAAMHPRIDLVMAEMPSNTDIHTLIQASEGGFKAFKTEHIQEPKWLFTEIDLMSYAKLIKKPVLLSTGSIDPICPPQTAKSFYEKLSFPKRFLIYEGCGHGGYDELLFKEKCQFILNYQKKA